MEQCIFPFEVFLCIVEHLPDAVVASLWCTGRELHGMTKLFNKRVLPTLRAHQWVTFLQWMHGNRRCTAFTMQLHAGPLLESMGTIVAKPSDTDEKSFSAESVTGLLHHITFDTGVFARYHLTEFGDYWFDFALHWDRDKNDLCRRMEMIVYYDRDRLRRSDTILVSRVVYWSFPRKCVEIFGTVIDRGNERKLPFPIFPVII